MSTTEPFNQPTELKNNTEFICALQSYNNFLNKEAPCPCPRWQPALILTAEIRAEYETWLPITELFRHLRKLALQTLKAPHWLPWTLHQTPIQIFASCPDFWQNLPIELAGHRQFSPQEIPKLLCAIADPPKFGSDFNRYPQQLEEIIKHANKLPKTPRILDIGCGTGQGTWEIAKAISQTGKIPKIIGITREPLEAWMAKNKTIPHDAKRHTAFNNFQSPTTPKFFAADFFETNQLPTGKFDLIICNGVIGGQFVNNFYTANKLLHNLAEKLNTNGVIFAANRFHHGRILNLKNKIIPPFANSNLQFQNHPNTIIIKPKN